MARIVLPIAGAVVGSFFGNPAAGWAIGSAIAAVVDPVEGPDITQQGARLSDLSVTSSTYGGFIPICWGTSRLAGNIIWALPLEEEKVVDKQESGGKGGGGGGSVTTVTYNYYATFAMAFGEGVAKDVIRIWADGKLLYSAYDESDRDLADTPDQNLLDLGYEDFTFYPGDETQLPDPLIVADKGELAPAHRGMCYMVFERLPLNQFGNRIPNITCEIAFQDVNTEITPLYADLDSSVGIPANAPAYIDWDLGRAFIHDNGDNLTRYDFNTGSPERGTQTSNITSTEDLDAGISWSFGDSPSVVNSIDSRLYCLINDDNASSAEYFGAINPFTLKVEESVAFGGDFKTDEDGYNIQFATVDSATGPEQYAFVTGKDYNGTDDWRCFMFKLPTLGPTSAITLIGSFDATDVTMDPPFTTVSGGVAGWINSYVRPTQSSIVQIFLLGGRGYPGSGTGSGDENTLWYVNELTVQPEFGAVIQNERKICEFSLASLATEFPELNIPASAEVRALDQLTWDVGDNTSFMFRVNVYDTVGMTNTDYWFKWDIELDAFVWGSDDFVLRANGATTYDVGVELNSVASNTTAYYNDSSDELEVYDTRNGELDYSTPIKTGFTSNQDTQTYNMVKGNLWVTSTSSDVGTNQAVFRTKSANGEDANVQDIIEDITTKVGLDPNLFTVTTAKTVKSYRISNLGSGRTALGPIATAFELDIIESDFGLKVVERGQASATNIPDDDLVIKGDANIYTENRIQEVTLPAKVGITYFDKNIDYQQRTQQAKRILKPTFAMNSYNSLSMVLPMTLEPDFVKQLAEKVMYTSWAERVSYSYDLPPKYLALEPTDVVTVDFPSASFEQRLSETSIGTNLNMGVSGISTDAAQYVSDSFADSNLGFRPPSLPAPEQTRYFLLDTPLLRDSDANNRASDQVYHAAAGYGAGAWPGATINRSPDGSIYTAIEQVVVEATWGHLTSVLPDTDYPFTPDTETTLTVTLVTGALESITDSQLLSTNDNAAAILKSNGDIEIIQFRDVTALGGDSYELSYILRGRRGTDYTVNGHTTGEVFVLLAQSNVVKTTVDLNTIGQTRYYKAVGFGAIPETIQSQAFASEGNTLKPYAPVNVQAVQDGSDVDLSWDRRTRVNGGLRDGTGTVPLNEETEEYEIEIYDDAAQTTLLRTVTGLTSPEYTYLSADLTTDFGGIPTEINLIVYQISAEVDRGFGVLRTVEVQ